MNGVEILRAAAIVHKLTRRTVPPADPFELPTQEEAQFRHCKPCDVKWRGSPVCWCCGQPATDY